MSDADGTDDDCAICSEPDCPRRVTARKWREDEARAKAADVPSAPRHDAGTPLTQAVCEWCTAGDHAPCLALRPLEGESAPCACVPCGQAWEREALGRHDAGTGDHPAPTDAPAPTCEHPLHRCTTVFALGKSVCDECGTWLPAPELVPASPPPSPGGEEAGTGDEAVATGRGWFSYDPEDGVDFHATEREAREAADRALDMERDSAADGGWNENAVDICYGRVYGSARQVSATPTPGGEFDEIVDYGIVDDLPREESPGYLRAAVSRLAADVERLTRELEAARNKEGK